MARFLTRWQCQRCNATGELIRKFPTGILCTMCGMPIDMNTVEVIKVEED